MLLHALSFLQNERIQPLSVILNTSSSTDVLDLQSETYTKSESVATYWHINWLTRNSFICEISFDRAYYELAMICKQLPHLSKLNTHKKSEPPIGIKSCPENSGIQQSLKSRLVTRVQHLLNEEKKSVGEKLQVKLSGDGIKYAENSILSLLHLWRHCGNFSKWES